MERGCHQRLRPGHTTSCKPFLLVLPWNVHHIGFALRQVVENRKQQLGIGPDPVSDPDTATRVSPEKEPARKKGRQYGSAFYVLGIYAVHAFTT